VSGLKQISLSECRKVGVGTKRPEDVVVARDGTVWISDQASACARVRADGTLERVGHAGGAPNGINLDLEGRVIIANFGGPEDGAGPLQRLDPRSGEVRTLCAELTGRKLFGANYPLLDTHGRIWCSHSTFGPVSAAFDGLDDGLIFRYDPDGRVTVVAEGLKFANGMAFDADEKHLFVCQTSACDVVRLPLRDDGTLGAPVRYGPQLGLSHHDVQDRRPLTPALRSELGATDGCGFDQDGNLWVTLVMSNKIVAITPGGAVVTMLSDPQGELMRSPTNVSWGGPDLRDLYIGSVVNDYVIHLRSPVPGMPLVHQR
jgi:gluconolactonase